MGWFQNPFKKKGLGERLVGDRLENSRKIDSADRERQKNVERYIRLYRDSQFGKSNLEKTKKRIQALGKIKQELDGLKKSMKKYMPEVEVRTNPLFESIGLLAAALVNYKKELDKGTPEPELTKMASDVEQKSTSCLEAITIFFREHGPGRPGRPEQ